MIITAGVLGAMIGSVYYGRNNIAGFVFVAAASTALLVQELHPGLWLLRSSQGGR